MITIITIIAYLAIGFGIGYLIDVLLILRKQNKIDKEFEKEHGMDRISYLIQQIIRGHIDKYEEEKNKLK